MPFALLPIVIPTKPEGTKTQQKPLTWYGFLQLEPKKRQAIRARERFADVGANALSMKKRLTHIKEAASSASDRLTGHQVACVSGVARHDTWDRSRAVGGKSSACEVWTIGCVEYHLRRLGHGISGEVVSTWCSSTNIFKYIQIYLHIKKYIIDK